VLREFKFESAISAQGRYRVLQCEQRGNRFTLQLRYEERTHTGYVEMPGDYAIETMNFWCERGTLVRDMGRIYRPTDRPTPEAPYKSLVESLRDILSEFGSLYNER